MQAKTLETSIETTRREIENPTEVEIELKRRLSQLTDHLIQKQAQVCLSNCITLIWSIGILFIQFFDTIMNRMSMILASNDAYWR